MLPRSRRRFARALRRAGLRAFRQRSRLPARRAGERVSSESTEPRSGSRAIIACANISSSLATRSVRSIDSPVIFLPGRGRLATCPVPTGSAWLENTMGNGFGRLSRGLDHRRRRREDDVDIHARQFRREFRQLLNFVRPAKFNDDILALDIAEITQARAQRLDPARAGGSGPEVEVSDAR